MKSLSVIILAAGLGSRMQSSLPKALITLANTPLIDHLIYKAQQLNPQNITVVIAPTMLNLQNYLTAKYGNAITINYQNTPNGSGSAVLSAKNSFNSHTATSLILYVDTPLISLQLLQNLVESVQNNNDIAVLSFIDNTPNNYGKLIFKNNQFIKITEAKELPDNSNYNICNSGVIAIKTNLLWQFISQINNHNSKQEYYLTDIVHIITSNNYTACNINASAEMVKGANTKAELASLEETFQNQQRNYFLNQGVQMLDPKTVYFSFDTVIGQDVIIHQNVVIGNNTIIGNGTQILPFSHIQQATVGQNCTIGPFARLRPQAVLHNNVHVGNFVEIKKSTIYNNVKVNHLSYVGDAEINHHTNIGAGFVSCNYDGKNKHKTIIGEHSFVGSNVAMVAPITIGNNTTIAAGSTITKNVNNNNLAIARAHQVNKPNYVKKT